MFDKNGQLRNLGDLFKLITTAIIGIILLSALVPIVSSEMVAEFKSLSIIMILVSILGIILSIFFEIKRHFK